MTKNSNAGLYQRHVLGISTLYEYKLLEGNFGNEYIFTQGKSRMSTLLLIASSGTDNCQYLQKFLVVSCLSSVLTVTQLKVS